MVLKPNDDRPHPGVAEEGWLETWGFELASTDGVEGMVRLTRVPEIRRCWFWTQIVGREIGIVVVRDEDVAPPKRDDSLDLRGDGLWASLACETPFEHWSISLEAFGLRVDTRDDDIGERIPVGLDLEWEFAADATPVDAGNGTRYTQAGTIHGEIIIDDDRIEYEGPCVRDHAWGRIALPTWS
jgi:hypothetical protein